MAGPDELDLGMRRFVLPLLFVLALFVALWVRRPDPPPPDASPKAAAETKHRLQGAAFGTTWSVTWFGADALQTQIRTRVESALKNVDAHMSTYATDSEISRFNAHASLEPRSISPELHRVLTAALVMAQRTQGAFDPTIGPLVNAWGFGPEGVTEPPSEAQRAAAKARIGWTQLKLTPGHVQKTRPDLYVDLSAVAKGYAVDMVGQVLEKEGILHYLVEIGGEVRTRGHAAGRAWRLGLERPDGGKADVFEVVTLTDQSLATSGNYRQSVLVNGQVITHILDGRTGQPITHGLGSVSVLRSECMDADAWATALYVLGEQEGLALAESATVAALFLTMEKDRVRRTATSHWPASSLPSTEKNE